MKHVPVLILTCLFVSAPSARAEDRKTGFYVQLTAPEVSLVSGDGGSTLGLNGRLSLGYDVSKNVAIEGGLELELVSEPYDGGGVAFLGRFLFYPRGAHRVAPYIFAAAGAGGFEDEGDAGNGGQLLIGGGGGLALYFAHRHAFIVEASDIFHETTSVAGNLNFLQLGIGYRFTF